MSQKSNQALVVKHNEFINARYQLSVAETRIILRMITMIGRRDEDFKPYKIFIKDFIDEFEINNQALYHRAMETTKRLLGRVLQIPTETGLLQTHFVSSAEYVKGEGSIELCFDPKLKPYLLQLKSRFTQYDIHNVLQLQSYHSIRIYELLKQYEKLGERFISVKGLKEILKIEDKYSLYADFKRYVILQAQKELRKNTDLDFEFEEIKTGRKVTHLKFKIIRHKRKKAEKKVIEVIPQQEDELDKKFALLSAEEQATLTKQAIEALDEFMAIQYERHGMESLAVKAAVEEKILELLEEKEKSTN